MSAAAVALGEIICRRGAFSPTGSRALAAARDPSVGKALVRAIIADEERAVAEAQEVLAFARVALEALS